MFVTGDDATGTIIKVSGILIRLYLSRVPVLEVGNIAVPSVEMFAKSVVAFTDTVTNVSDKCRQVYLSNKCLTCAISSG